METLNTSILYDNSDLCGNCNGSGMDCTMEPCHVCRGTGSIMFKLSFCNNGVRNMRISKPAGCDTWKDQQAIIRKTRTINLESRDTPLMASAQILLDALKELLHEVETTDFDFFSVSEDILNKSKEAIKKATSHA